ncbi:gamma-tubulin complex component 6-like isoform X2 [Dysidea avara]|uniref:gamma-tubulin complex component 6-like isoform X2 n=1 Tax=Dysidea avara TaxID=196820 RepID=UPI0033264712
MTLNKAGVFQLISELCSTVSWQVWNEQGPARYVSPLWKPHVRLEEAAEERNKFITCRAQEYRDKLTEESDRITSTHALLYELQNIIGSGRYISLWEETQQWLQEEAFGKVLRLLLNLPNTPVCSPVQSGSSGYSSYSSDLFEEFPLSDDLLADISQFSTDSDLFSCQPGSGLNSFFSLEMCPETLQPTRTDLFSGLTHSQTSQLNITLVLPQLPEYNEHYLEVPSNISLLPLPRGTSISSDEGLGTTACSHDTIDGGDSPPVKDPWPLIESDWDQPRYWQQKTWEGSITSERPYLTEAGTEAVDHMMQINTLQLVELVHAPSPPTTACHMSHLVHDTQNILIGLPAHYYTIDKASQSFQPVSGLKVTGCSPHALRRLMEQFAVAGSDFLRLSRFATGQKNRGTVARSLAEFLSCFVHCYTAAVVSTQDVVGTLIRLRTVLHKQMMTLRLMAKLCRCDQHPDNVDKFPRGMSLINTVYQHCLAARADPSYPLMLSLLRYCCKPYILFIQQWIYEGMCADPEEEFGIVVHDDYLLRRNETYWTNGHTLLDEVGCCPVFFSEGFSPTVFSAGKSLHLLKLCNPNNQLCSTGHLATPPIEITFDVDHLELVAQQCQEYELKMEEYMKETLRKQEEEELRVQEEQRRVLSEARMAAMEEEKERQSEEQAVLLALEAKKKAWLDELKAQMEQDLELRAMKKKQEREEDMAWMRFLQEREAAYDEAERKALEAAKQELVEHYESLMKDATLREQRAEWRTQRLELNDARQQLWLAEREQLKQEMESFSESDKSPLLPQQHSSSDDVIEDHVVTPDVTPITHPTTDSPLLSEEENQNVEELKQPSSMFDEPHPLNEELLPQTVEPLNTPHNTITMSSDGYVHTQESHVSMETASSSKPHVSDSVVHQVLNPTSDVVVEEFSKHLSPRQQTRRGRAPVSTIQDIMYPSNSPAPLYHTTRGKPPPTTIQNLLYHRYQQPAPSEEVDHQSQLDYYDTVWVGDKVEPFVTNYDLFDLPPASWLAAHDVLPSQSSIVDLLPLSTLLWRCIAVPLDTQARLVNSALVQYFTTELAIQEHFLTLKSFLLLEDGEFGHALTTSLFGELARGTPVQQLCSSVLLNPILATSLESSVVAATCRHTSRLSFSLKYHPTSIKASSVGALDFLELQYKVDWPCNIVITEQNIVKYNKVFEFLVELKRASWALKNVFFLLKKYQQKYNKSTEMRQLQVFRHEMQQFINVMEGYIVNQVLHVSWLEFQKNLKENVSSLDDLRDRHSEFIDKALFRCLLSKKAAPVMNIIKDIFSNIHKFHFQLTSSVWEGPVSTAHTKMCETHKRFHQRARFLFTVVTKLVQRGYQPHLEDFLLRLNFNLFYKL